MLHYCMLMWRLRGGREEWGAALSANPAAAEDQKVGKQKGWTAANAVNISNYSISNYSITALPFWDWRDSTVVIPWQFTASDATVITFLILNLVAWGRVRLSTTATVLQQSWMGSLFWGIHINITRHHTLVKLKELISFSMLNRIFRGNFLHSFQSSQCK